MGTEVGVAVGTGATVGYDVILRVSNKHVVPSALHLMHVCLPGDPVETRVGLGVGASKILLCASVGASV